MVYTQRGGENGVRELAGALKWRNDSAPITYCIQRMRKIKNTGDFPESPSTPLIKPNVLYHNQDVHFLHKCDSRHPFFPITLAYKGYAAKKFLLI